MLFQVYHGHLAEYAHVHGAGVDLLGVDDCKRHRVREGEAAQGGDEGHGAGQRRALVSLVHYLPRHDGHIHPPAARHSLCKDNALFISILIYSVNTLSELLVLYVGH